MTTSREKVLARGSTHADAEHSQRAILAIVLIAIYTMADNEQHNPSGLTVDFKHSLITGGIFNFHPPVTGAYRLLLVYTTRFNPFLPGSDAVVGQPPALPSTPLARHREFHWTVCLISPAYIPPSDSSKQILSLRSRPMWQRMRY